MEAIDKYHEVSCKWVAERSLFLFRGSGLLTKYSSMYVFWVPMFLKNVFFVMGLDFLDSRTNPFFPPTCTISYSIDSLLNVRWRRVVHGHWNIEIYSLHTHLLTRLRSSLKTKLLDSHWHFLDSESGSLWEFDFLLFNYIPPPPWSRVPVNTVQCIHVCVAPKFFLDLFALWLGG